MMTSLNKSIDNGIKYLIEHQIPNGQFITYACSDPALQKELMPDSNNFITACIGHSLLQIDHGMIDGIVQKSLNFLSYQSTTGGTWGFFTKDHLYHNIAPIDVDDSCCISALYRDFSGKNSMEWNKKTILSNRAPNGLFYSWFIPRFRVVKNKSYWKLVLRRLKMPVHHFIFWRSVEATRNDIDGVVNANALYYFGDIPEMAPVIKFLIEIIENEKEENCDLWYLDALIVYYFFTRNYHKGIKALEPIVEPIKARTLAKQQDDGSFGKSVLETSCAVSTLLNIGYTGPEVDKAIKYIQNTQHENGSWQRWAAFYGGPKRLRSYGSEELTTGFCLEALGRYIKLHPEA